MQDFANQLSVENNPTTEDAVAIGSPRASPGNPNFLIEGVVGCWWVWAGRPKFLNTFVTVKGDFGPPLRDLVQNGSQVRTQIIFAPWFEPWLRLAFECSACLRLGVFPDGCQCQPFGKTCCAELALAVCCRVCGREFNQWGGPRHVQKSPSAVTKDLEILRHVPVQPP